MKMRERLRVPKNKYGKIIFGNHNLEQHEVSTIFCLASFGFDIETLPPTDVPNSNNPDLILLGTFWEMKRPKSFNKSTIKKRLRKANRQSCGKVVFDLRDLNRQEMHQAVDYIVELFKMTRGMSHAIIIVDDDKLLDIVK